MISPPLWVTPACVSTSNTIQALLLIYLKPGAISLVCCTYSVNIMKGVLEERKSTNVSKFYCLVSASQKSFIIWGFSQWYHLFSPQLKRSVQSCKQWKGHSERERERERERSPHLGKNLLHSLHNFIAYVVYIMYGHDFQVPRTHQGDLESCSIPYHGAWVAQPHYNLKASTSDNQQTNPPSSRCNQSL